MCFGGCGASVQKFKTNEYYNDIWEFNILTNEWKEIKCNGEIPLQRCSHGVSVLGNHMFMYGGFTSTNNFSDLAIFDLKT